MCHAACLLLAVTSLALDVKQWFYACEGVFQLLQGVLCLSF